MRLGDQTLVDDGTPTYTNDPSPRLRLVRSGRVVPTRLEVELEHEPGNDIVALPGADDLHLGMSFDDRVAELSLSALEDGAYRLIVRGAPLLGAGNELGEPTERGPFSQKPGLKGAVR